MGIRFKTGNSIKNLPILNTYAPHMNYDNDEIQGYWAGIQEYMKIYQIILSKCGAMITMGKSLKTKHVTQLGNGKSPELMGREMVEITLTQ